MNTDKPILGQPLKVANIGLKIFHNSLKMQKTPVVSVDWKPPAGGKKDLIDILDKLGQELKMSDLREKIKRANEEAVKRICEANPILVDIKKAIDVIPGMTEDTILHAGPPINWENMCGPCKGAIMGALVYEGKAKDIEEAEKIASSDKIKFSPCHHHQTVGPMTGIVSPSMWVFCVKNETHGNMAYCTLNEGLGKVLRFGAYDKEVIDRLKWMENVLAPNLQKAVIKSKGISVKNIISQALLMGDEVHNRNVAGTSLFLKEITPYLLELEIDKKTTIDIFNFISDNPHFFLNLSMASSKSMADSIFNLEYSTIMCAMARNGTEIGIRVAGLGEEWFTAKAGEPRGLYFGSFSAEDGNPDLGDSTITETVGLGGFAMASAPAIVKFVGGKASDAIKYTKEMGEITFGRHKTYLIPALNFSGSPLGVDIRKVVELQCPPIINTGIAHKKPGIGQIGAGLLRASMDCFEEALKSFAKKYEVQRIIAPSGKLFYL